MLFINLVDEPLGRQLQLQAAFWYIRQHDSCPV